MDGTGKISQKERIMRKPYNKWSHEEKLKLIQIRIQLDDMFTSKNANMNDGWRRVAERFDDSSKDFKACRQLWKNLCQKYKSFFEQQTGDGAGDDAPTKEKDMESWPYFQIFNEYAASKHNYHPPFLIDSSLGEVSMASPATVSNETSALSPPPSPSIVGEFSFSALELPTSPLAPSDRACSSSSLSTFNRSSPASSSSRGPQPKKLTDYERYCMKRDKKLSKQIGGLMAVFGQMVSRDYPDINVDSLLVSSSEEE